MFALLCIAYLEYLILTLGIAHLWEALEDSLAFRRRRRHFMAIMLLTNFECKHNVSWYGQINSCLNSYPNFEIIWQQAGSFSFFRQSDFGWTERRNIYFTLFSAQQHWIWYGCRVVFTTRKSGQILEKIISGIELLNCVGNYSFLLYFKQHWISFTIS